MKSRREFLSAGAAMGVLAATHSRAATTAPAKSCVADCSISELNERIVRRDFRGITKDMLPTPCLIVDLDLFNANVKQLADTAKSNGINVRPHVKVHKSVDVARHQMSAGAIGLTCSTIAEAELFSGAGIKGMMWTKQPVGLNNTQRAIALSKKDPTFMFVSDDAQVLEWVEEAAAAHNAKVRILVSVYAGLARQGMEAGQPAVDLAKKVAVSKHMQFEGFMAYSGNAAHVKGFEARRKASMEVLAGVRESKALALKAGLPVNIISGGSTGTYNIDHETGLTELQAATYVFMDTDYFTVGGNDGDMKRYNDFKPALTVLTTIDSQYHPNLISTDYGAKALARPTDIVKEMPWLKVGNGGAEYGALTWKDGEQHPKVGDLLEIYPSNLDMSTNAFDRYYIAQGDKIVDVWPIMGRTGAAQR
ncbi:MAG: putative 3-hydroxy-D-aspartate aldolase [Edaphobacter sp.]|nr:putative 3-hydroxy-D-aspartate aldolase [Edaphobacter sp.]